MAFADGGHEPLALHRAADRRCEHAHRPAPRPSDAPFPLPHPGAAEGPVRQVHFRHADAGLDPPHRQTRTRFQDGVGFIFFMYYF